MIQAELYWLGPYGVLNYLYDSHFHFFRLLLHFRGWGFILQVQKRHFEAGFNISKIARSVVIRRNHRRWKWLNRAEPRDNQNKTLLIFTYLRCVHTQNCSHFNSLLMPKNTSSHSYLLPWTTFSPLPGVSKL